MVVLPRIFCVIIVNYLCELLKTFHYKTDYYYHEVLICTFDNTVYNFSVFIYNLIILMKLYLFHFVILIARGKL